MNGETVQIHGADPARRLRLSTQVPMAPVFHTSTSTPTVISSAMWQSKVTDRWLARMLIETLRTVVVVALANQMAHVIWPSR